MYNLSTENDRLVRRRILDLQYLMDGEEENGFFLSISSSLQIRLSVPETAKWQL